MDKYKIGTHNSATGEEGSFLSIFITPFACCQSKTLLQQYKAGSRLFDIRLKKHNNTLYCFHGIWRSRLCAQDLLRPLLEYLKEQTYFELTYEGSNPSEEDIKMIKILGDWIKSISPFAIITRINKKKNWEAIEVIHPIPCDGDGVGFLGIHGLRCLIPIPWFWAKIHKPKLKEEKFTYIDFL